MVDHGPPLPPIDEMTEFTSSEGELTDAICAGSVMEAIRGHKRSPDPLAGRVHSTTYDPSLLSTLPSPAADLLDIGRPFRYSKLQCAYEAVIGWVYSGYIDYHRERRRQRLKLLYPKDRAPLSPNNKWEDRYCPVECPRGLHATVPFRHYHVCVRCGVSLAQVCILPPSRYNPLSPCEDLDLSPRVSAKLCRQLEITNDLIEWSGATSPVPPCVDHRRTD